MSNMTARQATAPAIGSLYGSELVQEAVRLCLDVFDAPQSDYAELNNFPESMDIFSWTAARWRMRGLEYSFGIELMVLFALAAIVAVLSSIALYLQYISRSQEAQVFWFFRKHYHNNSKTPYIVPHPLNIILAATLVTAIQLVVYLAFSFDTWQRNLNARAVRVASWFTVIWVLFFTAVWMSGFGALYLTFLAPAQFTRRGSLTGVKRRISPGLVNALCFGVPAAAIALIYPLQVSQAARMLPAMRKTRNLTTDLLGLSNTFQSQGTVSEGEIFLLVTQARTARTAINTWRVYWAAELGVWSLFTVLAMAISIPMCLTLVLSVHRRIRRMAAVSANLPTFEDHQSDRESDFVKPSVVIDTCMTAPDAAFCESPVSFRTVTFSGTGINLPSTPSSAVTSPAAKEYSSSPFFASPVPSSADLLGKEKRSQSLSKASIQSLRRLSQYAIFPGAATPQLNTDKKADLEELNRRYWHVMTQYITVFVVMAVICALALYEASSDIDVLTDCRRTNIAVVVVSFTFCIPVIIWLAITIYRLASERKRSGKSSPLAGPSPRSSNASSGLSGYTLNKATSPQHRDVCQLRKSSSPNEISLDGGLRIEFEDAYSGSRRPSLSEGRRRSSHRNRLSMDFAEALATCSEDVELAESPPRSKP